VIGAEFHANMGKVAILYVGGISLVKAYQNPNKSPERSNFFMGNFTWLEPGLKIR